MASGSFGDILLIDSRILCTFPYFNTSFYDHVSVITSARWRMGFDGVDAMCLAAMLLVSSCLKITTLAKEVRGVLDMTTELMIRRAITGVELQVEEDMQTDQ